MRFIFKTAYEQDLRLAKHGGHVFWYGLLMAVLLTAPWWAGAYVMSQLHFICIYSIVGFGLMLLTGFTGRGRMLLNDNPWSPSLDDRLDTLIAAGAPELIAVMPDCFTRFGGSQYMDSSATGRYATHVVEELVPWADARYRTLAQREHRGVAGKSSGGYGALHLGMSHPDVFGAIACHSGDMLFEYCYQVDFPKACSVIQEAGGEPFFDYQVPQAVIKLKQGFGRLIRTASDTGMVVILDPRVLTKGYGRTFLKALPECRRFVDGSPVADGDRP